MTTTTTSAVAEDKATDKEDAPPREVTIPLATKSEHYRLGGHDGWWKKISKATAVIDKYARKAVYGNDSLGWSSPVELGRGSPETKK